MIGKLIMFSVIMLVIMGVGIGGFLNAVFDGAEKAGEQQIVKDSVNVIIEISDYGKDTLVKAIQAD